MSKIKFLLIAFFVLISLNFSLAQRDGSDPPGGEPDNSSTRDIPVSMEIPELVINRFIAAQTFPVLQGIIPGTNYHYTISMTRPTVLIRQNMFKAVFTIVINSDIGNFILPITPSIRVPNVSVNYEEIKVAFLNFDDLVQQSNLPQPLKDIIIAGYNGLELSTFPSRMLNFAESTVPDFIKIRIDGFSISFEVLDRKVRFTVAPLISAVPADIRGYWLKRAPWRCSIRFGSNIYTSVREIKIYDLAGHEVVSIDQQYEIPKNGYTPQIDLHGFDANETYYYVVARFNSVTGEYIRKYQFGFFTSTYHTWYDMYYIGGVN